MTTIDDTLTNIQDVQRRLNQLDAAIHAAGGESVPITVEPLTTRQKILYSVVLTFIGAVIVCGFIALMTWATSPEHIAWIEANRQACIAAHDVAYCNMEG